MNRIDQLFKEKGKNILSVYFTAGYPQLDDTVGVIQALEKHGADLLEIGVPFSDPMADGPVIQASGAQSLCNGMSVKHLFTTDRCAAVGIDPSGADGVSQPGNSVWVR